MELLTIITAVVGKQLTTLFEGIAKDFGDDIRHLINNNILEYQVEEYNRNLYAKTLLHRVQPKILKDFYQPLFITPSRANGKFPLRNSKRIPTNSIKSLFKKNQFITIIGNAGSGKSTMVKYLFLNSIDTNFKIPIKVELRYLNDYSGSVTDFIKEKIFKFGKLATAEKIIERLLESGDFVFFLDGYDEIVSSKKERITKEIDDLVKIYNKNFYLLTSRPYTDIDLLPLFHNFQVCELSDKDINQFIKKQIPNEERELCNKIIEAVNNKENHSYKSFLTNPLLLSMFILTFQSYSNIPQKRNEFYSQVFDALFSVHDSMSKLAYVREKQCGLSKEQFIEVLKLFSFISYFDEKFIFSSLYLEKKFQLIKDKKKNISFDNSKLINDLQVAIGILNKEGTDYTFPHRSLQEYFAAIYIASLSEENKIAVYKKILSDLTDKKKGTRNSRDNFYLLLSELDEQSVIKFAILPFLEKYKSIKVIELDYKAVINHYVALLSVYDAFNYILKNDDLALKNLELSELFDSYMREESTKSSFKEIEKFAELSRKRLVDEELREYLDSYLPNINNTVDKLTNYLIVENNSDTEIIAMI